MFTGSRMNVDASRGGTEERGVGERGVCPRWLLVCTALLLAEPLHPLPSLLSQGKY